MGGRDTRTGDVLERTIVPALERGGYTVRRKVLVGTRPGGRKHIVDVVAENSGRRLIISLKWQQVSGTAEQKVPFEVISLEHALRTTQVYDRAYLVLGGTGWTLRDFYTSGGLAAYMRLSDRVKILHLEEFIALANQGKL